MAGPPGGPGRVGRPNKREGEIRRLSRRAGRVGRPSRWVGKDRESPRRARRGQKALPEGWEGSRGHPRVLGGDSSPPGRAGRGEEALLESWEGSGGIKSPYRRAGRIGRPSKSAGRG